MMNRSQTKLAETAGFGLSTGVDFERIRGAIPAGSIQVMCRALELAGIEFTNGGPPRVEPGKRLEHDHF
jgi:hypothetical protein